MAFASCESEADRKKREAKAEEVIIGLEITKKQQAKELAFQEEQERIKREKLKEQERIEREARLKKQREEQAIYDKYINKSLNTGSTPYIIYC